MPKLPIRPIHVVMALMLMCTVAGAVGVIHYTQQLATTLDKTQTKSRSLEQSSQGLQQRLQGERDEAARLQALNQTLTTDRDNVIAQIKLAREESSRIEAERDLLQRVLKRTSDETRELRQQIDPLAEQNKTLSAAYKQVVDERDQLREALGRAQKLATDTPAKDQLTKALEARKQDQATIKRLSQEATELKSRQKLSLEQLAKSKTRYEDLNERYTKIMAENTSMRHQVKKVPANVARLAQQHERMVKETADMHYNLGVLFTKNQQYYQAAAEFRKVLELRPDDGDSHYNLGVIYAEHLPDREKAVDHFRRYLEINPRAHDADWVKKYIASWQAWEAKERLE